MNLTYENVMCSCCKPGKILSHACWERNVAQRATYLKSKAYEGGTHYREERLACFYSSKGISFSDIPEHWIIFYQVKMAFCSI